MLLRYLKRELENADIMVLASTVNEHSSRDGVVAGGRRLAADVLRVVASQLELGTPLQEISFVGNSLGGLYVRYCAKMLFDRCLSAYLLRPSWNHHTHTSTHTCTYSILTLAREHC